MYGTLWMTHESNEEVLSKIVREKNTYLESEGYSWNYRDTMIRKRSRIICHSKGVLIAREVEGHIE